MVRWSNTSREALSFTRHARAWPRGAVLTDPLARPFVPVAKWVQPRVAFAALVHESKLACGRPHRETTHRPMLYDSGRLASAI